MQIVHSDVRFQHRRTVFRLEPQQPLRILYIPQLCITVILQLVCLGIECNSVILPIVRQIKGIRIFYRNLLRCCISDLWCGNSVTQGAFRGSRQQGEIQDPAPDRSGREENPSFPPGTVGRVLCHAAFTCNRAFRLRNADSDVYSDCIWTGRTAWFYPACGSRDIGNLWYLFYDHIYLQP